MRTRRISLRNQLVAFGLAATVVPILLLLATVFATSSEVIEGPDGDDTFRETTDGEVPVVVPVVAAGLAVAATIAVWIWSTRAVRPMNDITALADDIQAGSLDRRLGLHGAAREVQALADSFDQMLDRLERSSRTQQQLIEDTSHELRTPLAALAVNNEVIRDHPDPSIGDYEAALDRSDALVARLQRTIDQLLTEARSRTQQTRRIDNDLVAIVHRVVAQRRALDPEIPIVVTAPSERWLPIDGPSIERALTNLLENAARFSPAGEPVEIEVSADDPPTLMVTDRGPGVAPDDHARVFERYYRADERGGPGIGLALVKQIADAHGSIHIESPPAGRNIGTRFVMRFSGPE